MSDLLTTWASHPQRAVIFDFNGTLSNDEPLLLSLFTEMFEAHLSWSLTEAEYMERLAGRSDREIIEIVVAERAPGRGELVEMMLDERRLRYRALVEDHSPIEDDTVALIDLLVATGVPIAIVTGAQRPDVEVVLAGRSLAGCFSAVVTEEDVVEGKPDPEGFLRGAALLGVDPGAVLVFEDSIFGIRGAKAAGMSCIGLVGTKTAAELADEADAVIERLTPTIVAPVLRTNDEGCR